jgi:hypothetical protein
MESNISHPGNNKGSFLENIYYHILEETNISVSDIGIVQPEIPRRRHSPSLGQFVYWFHPGIHPPSGILEQILALGGRLNPSSLGRMSTYLLFQAS